VIEAHNQADALIYSTEISLQEQAGTSALPIGAQSKMQLVRSEWR
jgi:hypothetical protein